MPEIEVVLLLALLNAVAMAFHAVTGFGAAAVLAPVLPLVVGHGAAVVAILTLGVVINTLVARDGVTPGQGRGLLVRLLPPLVAGLPFGVLLAFALPEPVLQLMIGCVVLCAVAVQLRATRAEPSPQGERGNGASALPAGFVSGVFATTAGLGAPPIVLWLDSLAVPTEVRRYVVAAVFIVPNLIGIAIFLVADAGIAGAGLILAAALLPTTLIGFMVGNTVVTRVRPPGYRVVAMGLVICAASVSIVTAAVSF